jgi:glutamate-1-semialdehyde 2,1-aminomutase
MTKLIDDPVDGPAGRGLWSRADAVLPGGGIYFSRSADMAGRGVLPGFIAAADGCRITDVDGRRYLDFLCANGPNILGYCHPEVEQAVRAQSARLTSASLFPPALVDIVERLVARVPGMAWGLVAKNGSEVVSLGVRVARQHTQRPLVVAFTNAYHGNDPELASSPAPGMLSERTRDVLRVPWNDCQCLADTLREHGDRVAAVLLNPLDQNPRQATRSASAEFVAALSELRSRYGFVVVFDDVRHGLRLHAVGSHKVLGIEPELITFGKALGNGHAISALLGTDTMRKAARKILFTSTYMFEAPPMQAALKTLEIYDREDVLAQITASGTRLREGFLTVAAAAGHRISYSGPVTMPTLLFEDDSNGDIQRRFARTAAGLGAVFHPALNWNLCAAHRRSDIDEAVAIAAAAFRQTPPASA